VSVAEQVMHNGLSVNSAGPGKGAKRAPCGVVLTPANSAQKPSEVTCLNCKASATKRASDTAAQIRDARKAARDPKVSKA
jgi:hypothetical protein